MDFLSDSDLFCIIVIRKGSLLRNFWTGLKISRARCEKYSSFWLLMMMAIVNDANFSIPRLVRHGNDDDVPETFEAYQRSLRCFDGSS